MSAIRETHGEKILGYDSTPRVTAANFLCQYTRREFCREILYNNIAIIAIQHSKIYIFDTFGDFSCTVE